MALPSRTPAAIAIALAAVIVAAPACGGGGSGGGGGRGGRGGAGATTPPAGSGIAGDFEPPEVSITDPARGAYLSQASIVVRGRATDAGSGIAALVVNGATVAVSPSGDWQHAIALEHGVNTIVARAVDLAGNTGVSAVSVMFGEYRLATEEIPNAAGSRMEDVALQRIAPVIANEIATSGVIQQKLASGPLYDGSATVAGVTLASARVTVQSVTFDVPTLAFDPVFGGVNATAHLPNLHLVANAQGTAAGIPYSITGHVSAIDAAIDLGLDIGVDQSGAYVIGARHSTVVLHGFAFGINGIPTALTNIVQSAVKDEAESRLAEVLRNELPKELAKELTALAQPISRTWNGKTVTFRLRPAALAFDDFGFSTAFDGDVTAARHPSVPVVPGSLFRPAPAGALPALGGAGGNVHVTINENVLNRALFASWQAGFWDITIDQQFVNQFTTSLPFQLDGQLIATFFPPLQGMIPATGSVPLSFRIAPKMQPVIRVVGAPELLEISLGEMHLALFLDFGGGPTQILEVSVHLDALADVAVVNDHFVVSIGSSTRLEADLLSSAVSLDGIDVERFLTFLMPSALQIAAKSIAPIPVPALQGLKIANVRMRQDGLQGEFATMSADLQ